MVKYSAKRLAVAIPQLAIIMTIVFFLIRLLPADPVNRLVGSYSTPTAVANAKRELGLDVPLWEQYWRYVQGLAHGSLGTSWVTNRPITSEIAEHFPITLQLMVLGFTAALIVAIPLGMLTAIRPGGKVDRGVFAYGLFAGAQPDFWWGLTFIYVFVFQLHVFPVPQPMLDQGIPKVTGFSIVDALLSGRMDVLGSTLGLYLLPAFTMAFVLSGPIVKMVRANMLRFSESRFVLNAKACGLKRRTIATYTLRNALSPVVTLVGILFGFQIGGAVLIETVFSLNGLGQYAVERILALDYPALQGIVLVMTGFGLFVYLLMDLLYAVIDPRIKH
jgi:ABC-type dipeptide/oligopeptide/nickel transport system permease component